MKKQQAPTRKTPLTNKAIGTFITVKREKMKLTIRGASAITGIDYAVLNRIEKGTFRMSLPNAITFAMKYNFPLEDFMKHIKVDRSGNLI